MNLANKLMEYIRILEKIVDLYIKFESISKRELTRGDMDFTEFVKMSDDLDAAIEELNEFKKNNIE